MRLVDMRLATMLYRRTSATFATMDNSWIFHRSIVQLPFPTPVITVPSTGDYVAGPGTRYLWHIPRHETIIKVLLPRPRGVLGKPNDVRTEIAGQPLRMGACSAVARLAILMMLKALSKLLMNLLLCWIADFRSHL